MHILQTLSNELRLSTLLKHDKINMRRNYTLSVGLKKAFNNFIAVFHHVIFIWHRWIIEFTR